MTREKIRLRNRVAFAFTELARDKHFSKIPEEQRAILIQEAMALGDKAARDLEDKFRTNDPFRITRELGIKIVESGAGVFGKLIKKSEYQPKSQTIVIYKQSGAGLRLKSSTKETWVNERQVSRIVRHKLLVAHELFHYLELNGLGRVSQKFKIEIGRLGPLRFYGELKSLSEIAAHAFVETLLNLTHSPIVWGYQNML